MLLAWKQVVKYWYLKDIGSIFFCLVFLKELVKLYNEFFYNFSEKLSVFELFGFVLTQT